jgi:hypothetical protein
MEGIPIKEFRKNSGHPLLIAEFREFRTPIVWENSGHPLFDCREGEFRTPNV